MSDKRKNIVLLPREPEKSAPNDAEVKPIKYKSRLAQMLDSYADRIDLEVDNILNS